MAPEETNGQPEVATSETQREKESSPTNTSARGSKDEGTVESENGIGTGKEKSEDKDNKAWQEGDFAYEYVQLAQVRLPTYACPQYLHFTIQSTLYIRGSMSQTSPTIPVLSC